jgi:hypothetical protein
MSAAINQLFLERAIRLYQQQAVGSVFSPSRARCTATANRVVLRDRRRILAKFRVENGRLIRVR